jgi:hypothetical protein
MIRPSRLIRAAGIRAVALFAVSAPTALGCTEDRATPAPVVDAGGDATTDGATTGGDTSGALDAATDATLPGCPVDTGLVDPTLLIDDFEDATSGVPLIAGRTGGWYASGDATTTAIMKPLGDAPPEPIPGGRCGSRHALHVTGSGFLDWGAQVGLAMTYGANAAGVSEELPYDARARGYQGISFFARVGDTSATTVRFEVADEYARPEAGLCTPNGAPEVNCYDTFGVPLTEALSTQWKQFHIPWTGLAQQKFGLPGGPAPDVSKLYDISFKFPPHVVFDLWVDDITFY